MKDKNVLESGEILPEKYYSLLGAQAILGIKSRQYLAKYVREGRLLAITTGKGEKMRYKILGKHILSFKEKYDKGLIKAEKYSTEEVKMLLNHALAYCKENNLTTLEELIKCKGK